MNQEQKEEKKNLISILHIFHIADRHKYCMSYYDKYAKGKTVRFDMNTCNNIVLRV